jgi:hypothetical protein
MQMEMEMEMTVATNRQSPAAVSIHTGPLTNRPHKTLLGLAASHPGLKFPFNKVRCFIQHAVAAVASNLHQRRCSADAYPAVQL